LEDVGPGDADLAVRDEDLLAVRRLVSVELLLRLHGEARAVGGIVRVRVCTGAERLRRRARVGTGWQTAVHPALVRAVRHAGAAEQGAWIDIAWTPTTGCGQ